MTTHLLTGDDESILRAAVVDLVDELVGDGDRSMMVDEFDGDDYELRPWSTPRRPRRSSPSDASCSPAASGRFIADEVAPLVAYVGDPLDTTDLVLVAGGGRQVEEAHRRRQGGRRGQVNTSPPTSAKDGRPGSRPHLPQPGCG